VLAIDSGVSQFYAFIVHKFAIGVFGASGYAGRELCELVARHPRARLAFATANDRLGGRQRFGGADVTFVAAEDARLGEAELVFSALPHGASAHWVGAAHDAGAKVVDLSADLRPGTSAAENGAVGNSASRFASAMARAPYGLTEHARDVVRGADARMSGIDELFALTLTAGFFESVGYVVTERARYPEKIRRDCASCPRRFGCNEVCVARMLRADTLEYAA
jgi:hypothetical protein